MHKLQSSYCVGLSELQSSVGSQMSRLLGRSDSTIALQVLFFFCGFSHLKLSLSLFPPLSPLLYAPEFLCSWHQQPSCVFSVIFLPSEGLHEQRGGTEINRIFLKMLFKHCCLQQREVHGQEFGVDEEFWLCTLLNFVPFEF